MARQDAKTETAEENDVARKDAAADVQKNEGGTDDAQHAARRGPVRSAVGKGKNAPANKGKPKKVNQGNRSSRATREKGANNKEASSPDPEKEEEEEEEDQKSADKFWQYLVAASYASRKTRGDWGGGEGE